MRVRFHLPDFARHFRFNMLLVTLMEQCPEYFREGVEIASFYGAFPPSLWNGGRFQGGMCDKRTVKAVTEAFNAKGIPLRFTFTNPVLEKKHLSDEFCNMVMSTANNGLNEVIVVSPILEDYIRKNYPKYKLTSSTCKRITDPEKLSEELEKDYHIVVIDYDLNNRFEVLEKIPNKEKCEILVNACCEPDCKLRSDHYKYIGYDQIAYANHVRKYPNVPFNTEKLLTAHPESKAVRECRCMKRTVFDIKNMRCHVTPDDIWEKYVPMGFSQFKIEGRSFDTLNLMEHYLYYLVKPEFKERARFTLLASMEKNGIITINE